MTGCRAGYAGHDVRPRQPSWTQGVHDTAVITRTTVTRRTCICKAMSGAMSRGQVRYAAASRDQPQVVVCSWQQGGATTVECESTSPGPT